MLNSLSTSERNGSGGGGKERPVIRLYDSKMRFTLSAYQVNKIMRGNSTVPMHRNHVSRFLLLTLEEASHVYL